MQKIPHSQYPKELRAHPQIVVYVGGCPSAPKVLNFYPHAHTSWRVKKTKHRNTICFPAIEYFRHRPTMLHELAHILTNSGHTDKWRRKLLEIGGVLDADEDYGLSYHKEVGPCPCGKTHIKRCHPARRPTNRNYGMLCEKCGGQFSDEEIRLATKKINRRR